MFRKKHIFVPEQLTLNVAHDTDKCSLIMKKVLYFFLLLSTVIMQYSCDSDPVVPEGEKEPDADVTFVTGSPAEVTENSMTAIFTLSTKLELDLSKTQTEQGVCYSFETKEPTVNDYKVVYGSLFKGSWTAKLASLRRGTEYYYRPYLNVEGILYYGPVKKFTTLGEYVDIPTNAVDLGLPSGTLWADRNVGADSPEAYGDYYAWGETTTKSTYNWSTYKWCQGSYNTLTKYCTDSYYGTVDNKTTLDLEDDAAYVNMGKEWRMPTYAEQVELRDKCTWIWTTQNGTNGYKVTGPNGNSIFLPAAGWRIDSDLYYAGSGGNYWSSSLYESNPTAAWHLLFYSSDHYSSYFSRDCDESVRAVVR